MLMHSHLATNNNTLEIQANDDLGTMQADMLRLKQILLNILQNAAKFTTNGHISLRIERNDAENDMYFRIKDTGIGMNDEQLSKIFQPFVQADSSTTRRFGGSGLGLVIARQLARVMGGDITVESHIDRGTTFHIHIPIEPTPQT